MRKRHYNADVVQRKLLCMDGDASRTGHRVFEHPMAAAICYFLDRVIITIMGEECKREFLGGLVT
jgi:hypothetical protein